MIESLQDAYNKGEYLIIQIDHLNDRDLKEFFDGMAKAFTENEFKRTVIVNSTNRLRSKNANEFVQYMKEKMTVPIKCNKKIILYLSNRLFGWLHRSLMKIAEENGVNEEGPIADFLEKTDQDQRGPGNVIADIVDYFKTKKDVLFLLF